MKQLKNEILSLAEHLYPLQVKWRRHFHQFPELSDQEFETTRFIRSELSSHGIKFLPLGLNNGAAGIINSRQRVAVGIRADIDALPIFEKTRLPFRSRHEGVMHACGHDAHTAILMGTSIILQKLRSKIPGAVKLIFQPAEETPPGGADAMIKAGILKNPDIKMIFALHVDPTLPTGEIGLRDGPTMASVTDFDIIIHGRGGHAARPHLGIDAIAVASELVNSMQKIVSRETDPLEPVVITFGTISGGTARNVIADEVILRATARTLSPVSLRRLPGLIKRTVDGICCARGAQNDIDFIAGYPVLTNDRAVNRIYRQCYQELFGDRKIALVPQVMGGEDFAYYLQKTAGAMFRLGVRNNKLGANKPWHAADFMIDEKGIYYGTAILAQAVFKYFESR